MFNSNAWFEFLINKKFLSGKTLYKSFLFKEFFDVVEIPPSNSIMVKSGKNGKWQQVKGAEQVTFYWGPFKGILILILIMFLLALVFSVAYGTIWGNVAFWIIVLISCFSGVSSIAYKKYIQGALILVMTTSLVALWVIKI